MRYVQYLLDENVEHALRFALASKEPRMVVLQVGEPNAPQKGTKDPEILEWCQKHGFILVTNNRKSMPEHLACHLAQGKHMPGILEIGSHMSISETVDELYIAWGASFLDEYQDVILYLPFR